MTTARTELAPGSPLLRRLRTFDVERDGYWLLLPSAVLLLAHAFVPIEQFIHRGDDAFYYFEVARRFAESGFWTFDGVNPTNGVQPLWAWILTAFAMGLQAVGVTDPGALARVFVAFAALLHFGAGLLLYRLVGRAVTPLTGLAVAGGWLYAQGLVWGHVWGMENALYSFLLVGTLLYVHERYLTDPQPRQAIVLGALLGLTGLARLNAGVLIPCVLLYLLVRRAPAPLQRRFVLAVIVGAVASAFIVPYLAYNLATTGHLLPVSGAVKAVINEKLLAYEGVGSLFSAEFLRVLKNEAQEGVRWFITSRLGDGLWLLGSRLVWNGDTYLPTKMVAIPLIAGLLFVPALVAGPRAWIGLLRERFGRLKPFWYVLLFAALNVAIPVVLYPKQLGYAAIRWWWVEQEVVLLVLAAAVGVAGVGLVARRLLPALWGRWEAWRRPLLLTWVSVLVLFAAADFVRIFWVEDYQAYDWQLSWNDEPLRAAEWMSENLPDDALVGSWNAGIVGYYADQRIVNLDGLINGFDFLPYLEAGRFGDYVRDQGITYVSDIDEEFVASGLRDQVELEEVYSHYSDFYRQTYWIYRVVPAGESMPVEEAMPTEEPIQTEEAVLTEGDE